MITQTISSETEAAAEMLRRGGLVAVPTETVYGLAETVFFSSNIRYNFRFERKIMLYQAADTADTDST